MSMNIESALKYIHWPSIRVAAWFSVFVVGGCIGLLTAAVTIQSALHGRLLLEKDRLEDFRYNYEEALIETQLITRYHDDYQKLLQQKCLMVESVLLILELLHVSYSHNPVVVN